MLRRPLPARLRAASGYATVGAGRTGYALACYAARRQERHPPWVKYLDTNPRVHMKHGLRYLARVSGWTAGLRRLQRYSSRAMIVRWTSEAPS